MSCAEFDRQMDAYFDGALAPEEAEALRCHAAECATCAALLGAIERGERALRSVPARPAPPGMLAAVRARLEQEQRRWRWAPLWRLAMVAAPVGAAVVAMSMLRPPAPPLPVEYARSSAPPAPLPQPEGLRAFGATGGDAMRWRLPAAPARRPRQRVPAPPPRRRVPVATAPAAPEAQISPALMQALNRSVSVVMQDRPVDEVASRLAEEADVPVRVVGDTQQRVSLQARDAPLWLALQAMAEQTGARIEPSGDGVLLRVEPRVALQQADGEAQRLLSPAQQIARAPRTQTWSPAFGRLPQRQFQLERAPARDDARQMVASPPAASAPARAADALPRPGGVGAVASPSAPQSAPPDRATASGVRRHQPDAARPTEPPAPAPATEIRLQQGEVALFRVGTTYGALQVLGRAGGGLRYRLWVKRGDGRLDRGARTLRLATSARPGPIAISTTGATIAWSVEPSGAIRLRADPPAELAPAAVRSLRNLDVATLWPR